MDITQILFWSLTVVALGGALMVVTSKNPIYSVLWLIVTFFAISGHYVLMNAQFLAIVNIIVYAGAIMVLFLFVIMLMNINKPLGALKKRGMYVIGAIGAGCMLLVLVAALRNTEIAKNTVQMSGGEIGLVKNLGRELFTNFVVPFEIASILFLSAMVGAVILAKKDPGTP